MLETSEEPMRGGGVKNERTAEAENGGKEGKTTSENSLTNRPYSRYPPSLNASFRIDGIKAITSGEIGNTSNRRRVCIFYQNEKTILVMQKVRVSTSFTSLLLTEWTSSVATASMEVTINHFHHNLPLLSLR